MTTEALLQRHLKHGDDLRLVVKGRERSIVYTPERDVGPDKAGKVLSLAAKLWGLE